MDDHDKQTQPPPPEEQGRGSTSGMDQFAKYSELALVMPAGAFGGGLIGAFLDHRFGTHWIFLAGVVLGLVGGFVRIIRVAIKGSK